MMLMKETEEKRTYVASISTPFIPKRIIGAISDASIRTPTEGATTNSESSSRRMMIRGQPARSMNCRNLSMTHHLVICVLEFADHEPVSYTHLRAHETRHDLV